MRSALTGHLVLSTIHTNSAVDSLVRLMDMGVPGYLIVAAVRMIMAQRLVRQICPDCKEAVAVQPAAINDLVATLEGLGDRLTAVQKQALATAKQEQKLWHGKGCDRCRKTGYRGRLAIFEVAPLMGELNELIVEGASNDRLREQALKDGMITLKQDGFLKVLSGETTLLEVYRVASEQDELKEGPASTVPAI